MAKLWEKGYELDALIEAFTVGNDYVLDRRLIAADAVASIAHARMLTAIGILTESERDSLSEALSKIAAEGAAGEFEVAPEDEDGHTAIEGRLTRELGDAGKKIHTGRSRNDQVLASTRLFAREGVLEIRTALLQLCTTLLTLARRESETPMPGRTHLQPAMPSSVGLWAASFAELLLDDDDLLAAAYALLNRSPLGAAAGYGVPLPLDREMVAGLLGFEKVHHNVIAVNNSRGKTEAALLDSLDQIGITLGRFAQDLILFSMPEFGYFTIPAELCSGSSIMPQKKNPDGLELLRARSGLLSALSGWVKNIVRSLPSGYNRDLQDTKEPLLRGLDTATEIIAVAELTAGAVTVNRERLAGSLTPELVATDEVFARVMNGESFRDAYRSVAGQLTSISVPDEQADVLRRRTSTGSPGNPDLAVVESMVSERRGEVETEISRIRQVVKALVGEPLPLFRSAVK